MIIQKSFKNSAKNLYVIPTPIGNLEDITLRAINILKNEVEVLLCEDTRKTGLLLSKLEISLPLKAYHEYNKEQMQNYIKKLFNEHQNIGLVSDAGMPGISDPGFELIDYCKQNEINVIVLPGASAFILGAVASNFPNNEFTYSGFLHGSNSEKYQQLEKILKRKIMTIIYESTHKIMRTLLSIKEIDENCEVMVGRELTKLNEEYVQGNICEVIDFYENSISKGEFIIAINPSNIDKDYDKTIEQLYHEFVLEGLEKKEIIKKIAKIKNKSKNEIYMLFTGDNDVR